MSTGRYKSLVAADAALMEVGYMKAWVSLLSDFTTLEVPVLTSPTPLIGEAYTIDDAHTWAASKDPIGLYLKRENLETPGESVGDPGFVTMIHRPKLFIKGDGPNIMEVVQNLKNEDLIVFYQNECDTEAKYIQFGCACTPCEVEKVTEMSGTLGSGGMRGYEITFKTYCKYFYNGTIATR